MKPPSLREEPRSYSKEERFKKMPGQESKTSIPFTGTDSSLFSEGDTVEHERFGKGIIISIEGQPPNTTATVDFEKDGSKKLLLRFAKLRKL
jgi:DNA helicase-2/ATP-dependent DNA helicase PcrA